MIRSIPPAFIFILGAFFIPLFRGRAKQLYLLFVNAFVLIDLSLLEAGTGWVIQFLGYDLIFAEVDRLSLAIAYIFAVIGFLAILYSLQNKQTGEQMAAFLYMGSSLGVVFSGDYLSLFIFWEIMAFASVFLIWYRREKASLDAGFRYLFMHIFGGCCLLTGILLHITSTGSLKVEPLTNSWSSLFILVGFGLNTALIPLHTWLPDAYPLGTITGSVFLSIFTTKTGVYTLARCFSGNEFIAIMGGVMAVYGVVFALLQNDIRKLISYHIISQVGYMIAGIGVGTELGVNGGVAHLINNLLYKTLLFMCTGSVIYMTGRSKLTELGGLAKQMPVTCITCLVASFSISGAPGFNGFVSKGMVLASVLEVHPPFLELLLRFASVGTFLSFIKLSYFTFFEKNEKIRAKEVPWNMQVAMIVIALLCILIGMAPKVLFHILPYASVDYHAYTSSHFIGVLQLFSFAGLVFVFAKKTFSPHQWIILDVDYFYRMTLRWVAWLCMGPLNDLRRRIQNSLSRSVRFLIYLSKDPLSLPERSAEYRQWNREDEVSALESIGGKKERRYNENIYRKPMGVGVLLAILFLFFYGIIYFLK
ncbi:MAG: Na(+)/H(+) antiporter subunit D [Syntrophaceae bacterium]|nr:Na(+)/H(+) antiporter subunit D [Syntrophaceae bacterium]